jgi:ribosome-associated protein
MERLKVIVEALDDKRATNIDVLDISELSSLSDYFVICTCNSGVQVRAAADEVEVKMKEHGEAPLHTEGYRHGNWILLDYDNIIVHVMERETRAFYSLEHLWDDAKTIEINTEEKGE